MRYLPILMILFLATPLKINATFWGFYAHKEINRLAVFTLPATISPFFKKHIVYITENAVNPDERRYAIKEEAPRHYIDLDVYGENAFDRIPLYWDSAVSMYSEDTLMKYGIVPWHIYSMYHRLIWAFENHNLDAILRYTADIGHYIADANVPLHTTENYNGQLTNQHGIHGFWESRLPELYASQYDFFVGKAQYIDQVQPYIWQIVKLSHLAKDSVLSIEKGLSHHTREGKKYAFESRGASNVKVYSRDYSKQYHQALDGMVERRMRHSIIMAGNIWYSAWVDAGQPPLELLMSLDLSEIENKALEEERKLWKIRTVKSREHN